MAKKPFPKTTKKTAMAPRPKEKPRPMPKPKKDKKTYIC